MARKPRGPTSEGEGAAAENRKRGTSFKLNMLDALLLDDRATGADFKVGHIIIKHMNMQDGACFPSVKTIAAWANYADEKYVRERIKHLKEIGWLLVSRGNRRLSNSYDFDPAYLDILSRRDEILERRSDKRKPNSGAAERGHSPARARFQSGSMALPTSGPVAPPNTFVEHRKKDAG